jgi:hypothetical protein
VQDQAVHVPRGDRRGIQCQPNRALHHCAWFHRKTRNAPPSEDEEGFWCITCVALGGPALPSRSKTVYVWPHHVCFSLRRGARPGGSTAAHVNTFNRWKKLSIDCEKPALHCVTCLNRARATGERTPKQGLLIPGCRHVPAPLPLSDTRPPCPINSRTPLTWRGAPRAAHLTTTTTTIVLVSTAPPRPSHTMRRRPHPLLSQLLLLTTCSRPMAP